VALKDNNIFTHNRKKLQWLNCKLWKRTWFTRNFSKISIQSQVFRIFVLSHFYSWQWVLINEVEQNKIEFFALFNTDIINLLELLYPSWVKRGVVYPSQAMWVLYRVCVKTNRRHEFVHLSPHSPLTPVELETWKLAYIYTTWMAQKLLSRF